MLYSGVSHPPPKNGAPGAGEAEEVEGPEGAGLDGLDGVVLVVLRGRRARQVVDLVALRREEGGRGDRWRGREPSLYYEGTEGLKR